MGSSSKEAATDEHYPVDNSEVMGCCICWSLTRELQMGDVTGAIVSYHLAYTFVSDSSQFEAKQKAHGVIA